MGKVFSSVPQGTFVLRVLVIAAVLVGIQLPLTAEHSQPGLYDNVPCVEDPSYTYDLILPDGYADSDVVYPGLFISKPKGNPKIDKYQSWANKAGFIVVSINNSKNGPFEPILKAQDLLLKSLDERGVRMHHCLRYAAGSSGAGMASVKLVSRYPEQFAGVHISIHSGSGVYAEPFQAVTMYAGLNDTTHPWTSVERAIGVYQSAGNPLRYATHDGGHKGADEARIIDDVEWMYRQTFLTHPSLTPEDRDRALVQLEAECQEIAAVSDQSVLIERAQEMLSIPLVLKSDAGKSLIDSWGGAVVGLAEAASIDLDRFWILVEASQQPWLKGLDRDLRKSISSQLKTLMRDKAIKPEYKAYQAYQKLMAMQAKARSEKEKGQVVAGFKQLAEALPETKYGRMAAEQ